MHIVIFGANGPTGRLATRRVLDAGHSAVAVTRRPADFPFADPRLTVAGADARDAAAVTDVVAGADAVLSSLGVPFTRNHVDTYSVGTANIIAAIRATGARRLVVVSSSTVVPTPDRTGAPFALRLVEPVVARLLGKTVYDDMRRMEAMVRASGLDWTIVRPSGLFDLPRVTNYRLGSDDPVGMFTSRRDLADCLVALAGDARAQEAVFVSTVEHTPTMWQWMRGETVKGA